MTGDPRGQFLLNLSAAMVDTAVDALAEFGGLTLDRDRAGELLPRWVWYPNLTRRETLAVLARFPAGGAR